ncbi:MAG: UDP-N-acetylmuramoylalanyl-D-glutamate--2,6-diaminopimelate ligase, partial [Yonghaparkia sp.]|nr:UDP-N-acetylmuramoylalanyl-D-glutamate--2,6-diaminopimelate ligase [Microcella sp.]
RRTASGALLIDDAAASTPVEARAALRVLADIARDRRRSFAVMGELDTSPADWFDEHDALGRIVVRLDVSQLIVIGHGARHLHNAAGLEGSWDGESMLVDTLDDAYDVLRARLDPEDVVLVTAGARTALGDLVDRLVAGDA